MLRCEVGELFISLYAQRKYLRQAHINVLFVIFNKLHWYDNKDMQCGLFAVGEHRRKFVDGIYFRTVNIL